MANGFRIEQPNHQFTHYSEWHTMELLQVDLPCGLRTFWFSRLTNQRWIDDVLHGDTTYQGQTITFRRSSTIVHNGEGREDDYLDDWFPVDKQGRRCRLVIPHIERALVQNDIKMGTKVSLNGEGILCGFHARRCTGGGSGGTEIVALSDYYPSAHELKRQIIDHYERKFDELNFGRLKERIRAEHERIINEQMAAIPVR